MKFELEPRKEVLQYNSSMFDTQRKDALSKRVNQIMGERDELREFHKKLNHDHLSKVSESMKIHSDVNQVNASLIE
jgi:hypothetical protein